MNRERVSEAESEQEGERRRENCRGEDFILLKERSERE